MESLIHSFEIPWYIWMGFGAVIVLFLVKPAFRANIDALLARMLGLRPKPVRRVVPPKEDGDE